jgi:hypothetical protein
LGATGTLIVSLYYSRQATILSRVIRGMDFASSQWKNVPGKGVLPKDGYSLVTAGLIVLYYVFFLFFARVIELELFSLPEKKSCYLFNRLHYTYRH